MSISKQCWFLALSRSGFYSKPKGESVETLHLMRLIDQKFLKTPFYGSQQMALRLTEEGHLVSRHRVRRLMRKMGIQAIYQTPRTSEPHPEHKIYPYLLRSMQITRPNQVC